MLENLFRNNWKILAQLGFDYVAKHLLSRIRIANPFFASILEQAIVMGDQSISALTDNDPNNAAQLKRIVEDNYEELISLVLAGSTQYLKNTDAKVRIASILNDTAAKIAATVAPAA